MRLRQIALVADQLTPVRESLFRLLGLDADFADPGVGEFGLTNSVMAIGDTFLEVVSPEKEGTTAGRLLARRGGDGGYMVIVQVDDLREDRARIARLGVREVWAIELDDASAAHLHPRDVGGAILSFDQMRPPESWRWAGPNWQDRRSNHVSGIVGVALQASDPKSMANRWAEVFGRDLDGDSGTPTLRLDSGEIRFVQDTDGRGDGVCAVDFKTTDLEAVLGAAKALDLAVRDRSVDCCGTELNFVD